MDTHTRKMIGKKKQKKWHKAFLDDTLNRFVFCPINKKGKKRFWWKPDFTIRIGFHEKDEGSMRTLWRNRLSNLNSYEDLSVCNHAYKKFQSFVYSD